MTAAPKARCVVWDTRPRSLRAAGSGWHDCAAAAARRPRNVSALNTRITTMQINASRDPCDRPERRFCSSVQPDVVLGPG